MDDDTVAHKGCVVLELGSNIGDVEGAINFQNDVSSITNLQSYIMITTADVTSSTSVTVAGSHSHRTLGVGEDGNCQRCVWVESVKLLE